MNKVLILVLAVCLVSAHAFVKRDAPAPQGENFKDKALKQFEELTGQVEKFATDFLDPKKAKEAFDNTITNIGKAIDNLKPKEAPKA